MSERTAEPVGPPGPVRARLMRAVRRDERGEALPAAIPFLGVLFTVLVGVHVVIVAMARTAVQSAADAAVAAAQAAGPGEQECDGDMAATETECEGILRARVAMAASARSVVETRLPVVVVEPERGVVTVLVFGGTISPVFGGIELTAQACGPLDDVPAAQLDGTDIWRC